jgi:hypothetical protein
VPKRRAPREQPTPRFPPHFTREGRPKKSYRTQSEAASAAQLAWTLEKVDLGTYRCDQCHQWHIGRPIRDE